MNLLRLSVIIKGVTLPIFVVVMLTVKSKEENMVSASTASVCGLLV